MVANLISGFVPQSGSSDKDCVFLSVTPGIGLELTQVDPETKTIVKYGSVPLEYNESLKEIKDYVQFKTAVMSLFEELKINPKSKIVLSIPTVHVGRMELPLMLGDENITVAITSELDQTYIFKRCEPYVTWTEVLGQQTEDNRVIIYSAVQKNAIDSIKAVFTEIGATLVRLEISLISTLRAFAYIGSDSGLMEGDTIWSLMIINSNGYELVQMSGKTVTDYYSEPLALKTYEYEEVYDAINTSAQIAFMNYTMNKMVIMSNTNMVSAEHLASVININGEVSYIENNEFKKQELMSVSLDVLQEKVLQISIESIGNAVIFMYDYPVDFEFSGNNQLASTEKEPLVIHIKDKEYVLTEPIMMKLSAVVAAILIVPSLLLLLGLNYYQGTEKSKLDAANSTLNSLQSEVSSMRDALNSNDNGNFDVNNEIDAVLKNNRAKLINYSALGESIPRKVWVTYFLTREDGKVDIKGSSQSVEDIYIFYKNLKDILISSQIRLQKLDMQTGSVEDALASAANYEFEITNMNVQDVPNNNSFNNNNSGSKDSSNSSGKVNDLEEVEVD